MYHPFKRLEKAWNARTPVYLHPNTKENFIWQLKLTVGILLGMYAKDKFDEYRTARKHKNWNTYPKNN